MKPIRHFTVPMTSLPLWRLLIGGLLITAAGAALIATRLVQVSGRDPLHQWGTDGACGSDPSHQDAESEVALAVSPSDPKHLVAAWIQDWSDAITVGYSGDGGEHWSTVVPPTTPCTPGGLTDFGTTQGTVSAIDPSIAFGPSTPTYPQGIVYLWSNVYGGSPARYAAVFNSSTNGGQTWSAPRIVEMSAANLDALNTIADPARPGYAYAMWAKGGGGAPRILYVAHTTDGGQTWCGTPGPCVVNSPPAPVPLAGLGRQAGAGRLLILPPTPDAPNGTLVNVFDEVPIPTDGQLVEGPTYLVASRSTDMGSTWSVPVTIADPAEPDTTVATGFGVATAPDGKTIYAVWHRGGAFGPNPPDYCAQPVGCHSVLYSKSIDGGQTWQNPPGIIDIERGPVVNGSYSLNPLHPPTSFSDFHNVEAPGVAVAPDGTVGVTFYDHRRDDSPSNPPNWTDFWLRYSRDGGQHWDEKLLAGPFDMSSAPTFTCAFDYDTGCGPDAVDLHGPGNFGEYHGMVALPGGFATAFPLAKPRADANFQLAVNVSRPDLGPCSYTADCAQMDMFYLKMTLDAPLVSVVSRKVQNHAGTFDVDLPQSGNLGIECRDGTGKGNYTMVFTFQNTLTSVASASVTSGAGKVASSGIAADRRQYIVNLTGVGNAQRITVTLTNVADSYGNSSATISGSMGILLGDTNGDGVVDLADADQTKAQSGKTITVTNFREDVTTDGVINGSDYSFVKSKAGTRLH
jgi:hypothetical protein